MYCLTPAVKKSSGLATMGFGGLEVLHLNIFLVLSMVLLVWFCSGVVASAMNIIPRIGFDPIMTTERRYQLMFTVNGRPVLRKSQAC